MYEHEYAFRFSNNLMLLYVRLTAKRTHKTALISLSVMRQRGNGGDMVKESWDMHSYMGPELELRIQYIFRSFNLTLVSRPARTLRWHPIGWLRLSSVSSRVRRATVTVSEEYGHLKIFVLLISGTLNHDSYVYVHKYFGQAYFPVSVGAEK